MNKTMWKLIGAQRGQRFTVILALNGLIAAAFLLWFMPQRDMAKAAYEKTEQDKLALQNQIVELPKKYEQMKENEKTYDMLSERGFFQSQDRIVFRQILNDLRISSGVRQVAYDIKPQKIEQNQALVNTDKQLISSEVTVNLKGLTDLEMRDFLRVLQATVPGVSTISKQSFKRADVLNDGNLIRLGNGEPIDFVESQYSFNWYTLTSPTDALGMQTPDPANPQAPSVPAPPVANPAAPPAGGQ